MDSTTGTPTSAGKLASTPASKPTTSATIKMSASLKEKLRKLGRYHGKTSSPSASTPKMSGSRPIIIRPGDRDRLTTTPVVNRTWTSETPDGGEGDGDQAPQRRLNHVASQLKRKLVNDDKNAVVDVIEERCKKLACDARASPMLRPAPIVDTQLKAIRERIKDREEDLRKLRLVKLYRTKNDLDVLESLIEKWRTSCQQAVTDLYEKTIASSSGSSDGSTRQLKLAELLGHLQINLDLVRYDADDEDFY